MPGSSPYTYNRPTDILADEILARLGNDGTSLLKDLLNRLHQAFGFPVEIRAQDPASKQVNVGVGIYTMPDGQRVILYEEGEVSDLASGVIDFEAGEITAGSVSGFSLPSMTAGYYIRSLVSYDAIDNAFDVTFGDEASSLDVAEFPKPTGRYEPLYSVELYSPTSGVGNWDNIEQTDIIRVMNIGHTISPQEEVQTVSGSPQSIFTLTTIEIPNDRNRLFVQWNGVGKKNTAYTVTGDTEVTFSPAVPVGVEVRFIIV